MESGKEARQTDAVSLLAGPAAERERPPWAHFVGIGGMGMRGLAEMLFNQGWRVSGSDLAWSAYLGRLERRGITIHIGHEAGHVAPGMDVVVHTAAIPAANPELAAARALGIPTSKYAQMLGRLMAGRRGIAVSGTHGKTTTTAMIAWALHCAGVDPSFVIGADVPQLGAGSRAGGDILVVEACEYDRSFHNFRPEAAVITTIEEDHLDYYRGGLPEIIESFAHFARLVSPSGRLVACAEDRNALRACAGAAAPLHTYALDPAEPCPAAATPWTGETCDTERGCHAMVVRRAGEFFAEVRPALAGRHMALNALAATVILDHLGVPAPAIADALASFHGAERRSQLLGQAGGILVVDDYGHHPTEIRVTIHALRRHYRPTRLWCVFQPHQHSRTRFLLDDFARSFDEATAVLVPDIYFVRDSVEEQAHITSAVLVDRLLARGRLAEYIPTFEAIADRLIHELRPGDLLVTLGAGPVWQVAEDVLRRLKVRLAG